MTRDNLRLAVIGNPVAHSLSPAMHNAALRACSIEGLYSRVDVDSSGLAEQLAIFRKECFAGFNVTIPHKEKVVDFLDDLDSVARTVGAVNTVVTEDHRFIGYNTDVTGFQRILGTRIPGHGSALVIGAGGAARGCVYALTMEGWGVTVANRTLDRAEVAFRDRAEIIPLDVRSLGERLGRTSLLVNASSAGMNLAQETPLPAGVTLTPGITVLELVYSPLQTRLLREAGEAGCSLVDGLDFLAAQAADAFHLWTGRRLADAFFREAAESELTIPTSASQSGDPAKGSLSVRAGATASGKSGA